MLPEHDTRVRLDIYTLHTVLVTTRTCLVDSEI